MLSQQPKTSRGYVVIQQGFDYVPRRRRHQRDKPRWPSLRHGTRKGMRRATHAQTHTQKGNRKRVAAVVTRVHTHPMAVLWKLKFLQRTTGHFQDCTAKPARLRDVTGTIQRALIVISTTRHRISRARYYIMQSAFGVVNKPEICTVVSKDYAL